MMFLKARHIYRNFFRHLLGTSPFIPTPNTKKEVTKCENAKYMVGACSMQGWRMTMEDAHVHILEAQQDPKAAYFAVFDGHGGHRVADYAGENLHKAILGTDQYLQNNIPAAIHNGFLKLDHDMRYCWDSKPWGTGSTAIMVLIKEGKLFCGNAGDSRAVLSDKGHTVPLSFDHKPYDPLEMKRIFAAGGFVSARRVNGNLALSRAFGDYVYKDNRSMDETSQMVIAVPDVVEVKLTDDHEFVLLACDGIWDVLTNEEAVNFCRKRLSQGVKPEQVCIDLVEQCLAPYYNLSGIGCDNMTCVLVCLLNGNSFEDYVKRLQQSNRPLKMTTTTSDENSNKDKDPVQK